jgi:arylsulfatase A-like enzyme
MSLPEILQKEGYYCAAFNRNPYVSAFTGLDRGFHHFVADSKCLWDYLKKIEKKLKRKFSTDPSFNPERSSQTKTTRLMHVLSHLPDVFTDSGSGGLVKQFTEWINNLDRRPFFAFFQAVETHSPYRAPLKFGLKFLSALDLVRKIFINQDYLSFARGDRYISTDQFQILKNGYDNAIRYCDFITRQICRVLKNCKVFDDTLLIIMSDHGESIGEHNLMFHVWSLYDNLIKVPLIIKYPRDISITGSVQKIVQSWIRRFNFSPVRFRETVCWMTPT